MNLLEKTEVNGVSGLINFEGPNRKGIINIQQFQYNYSVTIGSSNPDHGKTKFHIDDDKVRWFTRRGLAPQDGSNGNGDFIIHSILDIKPYDTISLISCHFNRFCPDPVLMRATMTDPFCPDPVFMRV